MRTHIAYAALAAVLMLTGWLAGSRQPVEAQAVPASHYGGWQIATTNTLAFLYNETTGVTYRYMADPGSDCTHELAYYRGCFMPVPAHVDQTQPTAFVPNGNPVTESWRR